MTAPAYYCVGFYWDDAPEKNQLQRFIKEGIWENGYDNKFIGSVNNVPIGARIAAKTSYTKKYNGKNISVLDIKALGTVTENPKNGRTLSVKWDTNFKPFTLDGKGAYRSTINRVWNQQNIDLIFEKKLKKSSDVPSLAFDEDDLTDTFYKNVILYGPPGTGKTYHTINKAVAIADGIKEDRITHYFPDRISLKDRFDELLINNWENPTGQVCFVTFHQSMSYESFIEGIKPSIDEKDNINYEIEPGIFKKIANLAQDNWLDAQQGDTNNLTFEDAFASLRETWEENPDMKFAMKTEGKEFTITGFSKSSIKFKKASGGTGHTLSMSTLRDYYYNKREIRTKGVGIYYPGLLDKLRAFKPEQGEEPDRVVKNYVIIIDEINRGNIAQIFGELITLIEDDKRLGQKEEIAVTLPYSKDRFVVPPNLHIIGTMNTADRSVEALDTALRRRFVFEEMMPRYDLLTPPRLVWRLWWEYKDVEWDDEVFSNKESALYDLLGLEESIRQDVGQKEALWKVIEKQGLTKFDPALFNNWGFEGIDLSKLLLHINARIKKILGKDHAIGHAYFINVTSTSELKEVFHGKIIPLLQEFFYSDYARIGLVIGEEFVTCSQDELEVKLLKVTDYDTGDLDEVKVYNTPNILTWDDDVFLKNVHAIYA